MRLWKSFEKKIHGHMSRSGISKLLVRSEMYQAQAQGTGVQVKVQGLGTFTRTSHTSYEISYVKGHENSHK